MSQTRGLEGVVATTSSVSSIIDDVLTYQGYHIDDLAEQSSFEEVVYLLWNGKLPTKQELDAFSKELFANMQVPDEIFNYMKAYPIADVHPMAALRTAISQLGLYDKDADKNDVETAKKSAIKLQAKVATVVTGFARIRNGKELYNLKKA